MTRPTVSAASGAMSSAIVTRHDLIDEETGEVNVWALKALARREAMLTWGGPAIGALFPG